MMTSLIGCRIRAFAEAFVWINKSAKSCGLEKLASIQMAPVPQSS